MKKINPRREGFWFSKHEPWLPVPSPYKGPWPGKKLFVARLKKLEGRNESTAYRGASACRLCGCRNGSGEFVVKGWVWPSGYLHYITEHDVRPSLAFEEFVVGSLSVQNSEDVMKEWVNAAVRALSSSEDEKWTKRVLSLSPKDA